MGQPTPPGDLPLYEGLGSEWNDIVGAFPEDRRAELAPLLKARIDEYEPLKQWEDFQKSGITPDQADTALRLFSVIENNPREVYNTLAEHLNITPTEAKEVVKQMDNDSKTLDEDDPRYAQLKQQVEVLSQIMIAEKQQTRQEQMAAEQDKALEKELGDLKKKYGDGFHEDEILMRMLHKGMTAEQAYQEYNNFVTQVRSTRPSPMIMGSGGMVPNRPIDVKKLSNADTKNLVAQMFDHANSERRQ